ncbi:uncharacterized protein B4U79_17615 [Dinothrombium tinctorium]|uniref:TIR domain-containing protein n=1 Tax=Dinothrombium tinctorium TaxID=1965070 RepID=A0A3S3P908_9ACAR|nr:uncharacterized protein B4U79_17615 [Dinothrombium tinctorium]
MILKRELYTLGFSVYLDVDEIRTGSDWQDSLNNAVKCCKIFLPLITPNYGKTKWTNREVRLMFKSLILNHSYQFKIKLADMLNKKIIPINFLDQWPPDCLAIQFSTLQCIMWNEHHSNGDDQSKAWREEYGKKVAEKIVEEIRKLRMPKEAKFEKRRQMKRDKRKEKHLIVISSHPKQQCHVDDIKASLINDFEVWSTTDEIESITSLEGPKISLESDVINQNNSCGNRNFKMFETKVAAAKLVIVLASKDYFECRTSRQHVYYCEQRVSIILVKCDEFPFPSWFELLMMDEFCVSVTDGNYIKVMQQRIDFIVNPTSERERQNEQNAHEPQESNLIDFLKENIPILDTCVYVLGSLKNLDGRSEEICKAIGKELAKLRNLTLIINGVNKTNELVAKSFIEAKKLDANSSGEGFEKNALQPSLIHLLSLDHSKSNDCNIQFMNSTPYCKTLLLKGTEKERETAIARVFNTCILIGENSEEIFQVEEFLLWNDHNVIPVISRGSALNDCFHFPFKMVEESFNIREEDRRNLVDREASPEQVAKSVVEVVKIVKKCIASYKTEVINSNKLSRKSLKKRKTQEKLIEGGECEGMYSIATEKENLSDNLLPVVENDSEERKKKAIGKWRMIRRLTMFTSRR